MLLPEEIDVINKFVHQKTARPQGRVVCRMQKNKLRLIDSETGKIFAQWEGLDLFINPGAPLLIVEHLRKIIPKDKFVVADLRKGEKWYERKIEPKREEGLISQIRKLFLPSLVGYLFGTLGQRDIKKKTEEPSGTKVPSALRRKVKAPLEVAERPLFQLVALILEKLKIKWEFNQWGAFSFPEGQIRMKPDFIILIGSDGRRQVIKEKFIALELPVALKEIQRRY